VRKSSVVIYVLVFSIKKALIKYFAL